jgi:hypothetical protein
VQRQRAEAFGFGAHNGYGLLVLVDDIAEVAEGNCASRKTAMRSLRRHGMFAV